MRGSRLVVLLWVFWGIVVLFADSGGPDEFGYRWIDSDEPGGPTFDWIDITSTGTEISDLHCDDCYHWLDLPQPFEFYGIPYDRVAITSNGYLSFDESASYFPISATYSSFPDPGSPNANIAVFNCDLDPGDSPGAIYYQHFDNYTVIEWYLISEFPGASSHPPVTFEAILYYPTKTIVIQYDSMVTVSHDIRVGIENEDGTIGMDIRNWSSGTLVPDDYAIRIRATPVATPPYLDNFETETGDFSLGDSSSGWERGPVLASSPAFPPHSGGRCYGTILDGDYENNADWFLYTPHLDLTSAVWPIVDFWHWYSTEEGHDGGVVEVSTDEGETWTIIPPEDGYPTPMTTGPLAGESAFSGSSGEWVYTSFDLSDYIGQEIMMRLRFVSDAANTDPGWYVDDFGLHNAYGVVQGNVDLAYYEPDSGALVEIPDLGLSTITDTAGNFQFDTVVVGEHYLRVSKEHFVTQDSIPFSIDRFDTVFLSVLLAPELYNEDFEEGDGGMVPDPPEGAWEWGIPTVGPDSAHSGQNCWGTCLGGNYENNADWSLILQVPLYDVRWPLLRFYTWYKFEAGFFGTFPDGGNVKVSVDSGATWSIVTPVGGYDGVIGDHNPYMPGEPAFGDDETGDFWHEVIIPLYEVSGNPTIWIKFELASDNAITNRGWYIDDIRIADDSSYAGIAEGKVLPENILISATPNPFNSRCRIAYSIPGDGTITITDVAGKVVLQKQVSRGVGRFVWSADNVPSGMYFARVRTSSGVERTISLILVK